MRKLVLTTVGTQGDLHPFIALGLALERRGFAPVLAVPRDQVKKVRRAGLAAEGVLPGFDEIHHRMGLDEADAVSRIVGSQREMLEQVLLPALPACAEELGRIGEGAEAIIASIFAFAAPIVAEKRGLPLISVVLQPMALLSAHEPPRTPEFRLLVGAPVGAVGRRWNQLAYLTIRRVLAVLYSKRIDAARTAQGLPLAGAGRMFEPQARAALTLACWSARFAPLPPDAPPRTRIVGFPTYDRDDGVSPFPPSLERFLADGPPPLVFTLGTFAVNASGNFFNHAVEIARRLGLRAVLLTGLDEPRQDGGVFRCAYAPHSLLFSRACAIIHHGGIGTTGQALRAGRPQLVVPHMGDQHDHAHRVARLGVGLALSADVFEASRAMPLVRRLLDDVGFRTEAHRIGALIREEDGAENAADAIEATLNAMTGKSLPHS